MAPAAPPKGPRKPITDSTKWQLQVEGGRMVGPLTTEDLLYRIAEGILTGEEKIRKLPNGAWTVVSREPIFYDKLLQALSEEQHNNSDDQDVTVARKAPTQDTSAVQAPPQNYPLLPMEEMPASPPAEELPPMPSPVISGPEVAKPHAPPKAALKFTRPRGVFARRPVLTTVVVLLVGLMGYALLSTSSPTETGLHLKLPKPGTKNLLSAVEQNKAQAEIYRLD
jgi:hypothetical protein